VEVRKQIELLFGVVSGVGPGIDVWNGFMDDVMFSYRGTNWQTGTSLCTGSLVAAGGA